MLGIVCGLETEAALARSLPNAKIVCSGANPDRAREQARWLIEQGATFLLSFGLAGCLNPELKAGTLLIPSSVHTEKAQWLCAKNWTERARSLFPQASANPLWGTETIIAAAKEKKSLYSKSGCSAADMESHIVAASAAQKSIPFAVMRAVADDSGMNLPEAARVPLRENGTIDGKSVALSIARNPSQIPGLIRIGINTAKAMTALKEAAARMARDRDLWNG